MNRTPEEQAAFVARNRAAMARLEAARAECPVGHFSGQIYGSADYDRETREYVNVDTVNVRGADLTARFETPEAAHAYAASLPKFLRLKTWTNNTAVSFRVSFTPDGTTGDANETGMKRLRRFFELCPVHAPSVDLAYIVAAMTVADARKFVGLDS